MLFNLPEVNKALFRTLEEHESCTLEVEADFVTRAPDGTDNLTLMCRTHGRPVITVRRDGSEP